MAYSVRCSASSLGTSSFSEVDDELDPDLDDELEELEDDDDDDEEDDDDAEFDLVAGSYR